MFCQLKKQLIKVSFFELVAQVKVDPPGTRAADAESQGAQCHI